jgi:hypothetical protein
MFRLPIVVSYLVLELMNDLLFNFAPELMVFLEPTLFKLAVLVDVHMRLCLQVSVVCMDPGTLLAVILDHFID